MKWMLRVTLCLLTTSCLWAQDAKGFEGAWVGSFVHENQPPKVWMYVFENIQGNTCTGFLWNGLQHPWSKCEIKDGGIAVYQGAATKPVVTGKIVSPTQLELTWHDVAQIHTFAATKQTPEEAKELVNPSTIAGVDKLHMGVYRALADLIVENLKKNDLGAAAKLSRILEISWDRGENDLQQSSAQKWSLADRAMDAFINPIMGYKNTVPDMAKVDVAYHDFLDKLKQAESK